MCEFIPISTKKEEKRLKNTNKMKKNEPRMKCGSNAAAFFCYVTIKYVRSVILAI